MYVYIKPYSGNHYPVGRYIYIYIYINKFRESPNPLEDTLKLEHKSIYIYAAQYIYMQRITYFTKVQSLYILIHMERFMIKESKYHKVGPFPNCIGDYKGIGKYK